MDTIIIVVEGPADKKFMEDYLDHIFPKLQLPKENIVYSDGWTNVTAQNEKGEKIRNSLQRNEANGGINLIIFDADKNFAQRKSDIEAWKQRYGLIFELFLFPNNQDSGALEDLLENIIVEQNKPIFDCWDKYETCLRSKKIGGKTLTTPAKKTKIYGYLEALLGETKKEKDKIKEINRDYNNAAHWDLNAAYLDPLKKFLSDYLL